MQITTQIKLLPTKEQSIMIENTMQEYIRAVNVVVSQFVGAEKILKYTSKELFSNK